MRLAIMQPYFFPYIGYYQLINSVDIFIIYDNLKYTKKGWINRNRILLNGADEIISLPLKSDSDALNICDRALSPDYDPKNLLNKIKGAYHKAPYFRELYPFLESVITASERNLFQYLYQSIASTCNFLALKPQILISSSLNIDHTLKGVDKVIALCEATGAKSYINAIGGIDLYDRDLFLARGIDINFVQSNSLQYAQFGNNFVPWLSIIDVLMFNSLKNVKKIIAEDYKLI